MIAHIKLIIQQLGPCKEYRCYCETGGIMRQHKFCPDKQQYNNAKPFLIYVAAIEEVENYNECLKSSMVYEPGTCTCMIF